mgnify:FL=1
MEEKDQGISVEQLAYNHLAEKVGQLQAHISLLEAQNAFLKQELQNAQNEQEKSKEKSKKKGE